MYELGIYGGTFNPPHNGHVSAAYKFYDILHLDKLIIMPTFIPPHKSSECDDSPESRIEMCRIAFEDTARNIEVSDYEIQRKGLSYTYLTLQHFANQNTHLTFLVGTDMFLTLDSWKSPEIIFSLARIALIRRERRTYVTDVEVSSKIREYVRNYGADIVEITSMPVEVRSTDVRETFRAGTTSGSALPQGVRDYIIENNLYGGKYGN